MKSTAVLVALLLASCGDNIHPVDAGKPHHLPDFGDLYGENGEGDDTCANFDHIAPWCLVDAGVPDLDDETKAACCHALLNGEPPKHECGYPPGLCMNGRKPLFCEGQYFDLCAP